MSELAARLEQLKQQVAAAGGQEKVTIVAVSKTHPVELIREAHAAGQHDFGENYIQEAVAKIEQLADLNLTWHFIGHLQSNKAKIAAAHFDWVQSVHSLKLARKLNESRNPAKPLNITVQINISREDSKSGINPAEAKEFCRELAQLPNLALRGLMTISENTDSAEAQRAYFRQMRELFEKIGSSLDLPHWDTLSMGMSGDMHNALVEGSTMIRIGSSIFGPRT